MDLGMIDTQELAFVALFEQKAQQAKNVMVALWLSLLFSKNFQQKVFVIFYYYLGYVYSEYSAQREIARC